MRGTKHKFLILVNVLNERVQECNHGKGVNIDNIILLELLAL